MTSTTLTPCFLGRQHGHGCEIIRGSDITNDRVGILYNEGDGLVLSIDGDDENYLPDTASEVHEILSDAGFDLDGDSDVVIAELT